MRTGLIVLQISHVFYFIAAIMAWEKGYKAFSIALFAMITVSMINHRMEEVYDEDTSALEWFEKSFVIGVGTAAALQFRKHIDAASWGILGFSIAFFIVGHTSYYQNRKREYLAAHTIWHLGTGFAILRIINATPPYSEE